MQKSFFKKFFIEQCPDRQARSIACGAFIAFSPFLGFHTLMTIGAAYVFRLNFPLTLLVSCTINNPWSMVPIYLAGYFFGVWLFEHRLLVNKLPANPMWMNYVETFCTTHLGIKTPSLWTFLLGGTMLSILVGCSTYFIVRLVQKKLTVQHNPPENNVSV